MGKTMKDFADLYKKRQEEDKKRQEEEEKAKKTKEAEEKSSIQNEIMNNLSNQIMPYFKPVTGSSAPYANISQEDSKKSGKKTMKDFADLYKRKQAGEVGLGLGDRINSFLSDYDAYTKEYLDRTSGFTATYNDSYVSGSSDWFSSITTKGNELETKAKSIISDLDMYSDFYDPDAVKKMKNAIVGSMSKKMTIDEGASAFVDHWSQWKDENEYKEWVGVQKQNEEYASVDLDYEWNRYNQGKTNLEKAKGWANRLEDAKARLDRGEYDFQLSGGIIDEEEEKVLATIRAEVRNAEAQLILLAEGKGVKEYEKYLSERHAYLTNAERYQEGVKLASAVNASDFEEYAQKGMALGIDPKGWKKAENTVANLRNNPDSLEIYESSADSAGGATNTLLDVLEYKAAKYMTDEEFKIYNYYFAKDRDKAEQYLESIEYTLTQRQALGKVADVGDSAASKVIFGLEVGVDNLLSGLEKLISNDDYYVPSATQIAGGIIREDLGESGIPFFNFSTGKWEDWDVNIFGSSVGQATYDALNTGANMLPSILASAASNIILPGSGVVVGNTLMGASAAGHAKADMINLGYTEKQANQYAMLIGSSEALLQYAIGGVSSLGGKLSGSSVSKLLSKVDNAFARVVISTGGNMLSEGFEEGLQTVLEPWFKSIVTKADFEAPNIDEVLYSSLLGALSAGVLGNIDASNPNTIVGAAAKGITTHNQTKAVGKQISGVDGAVARLAELGSVQAADSVAYKVAQKINKRLASGKNVGAYTIGKLFNAEGAALTDANISDITTSLTQRGVTESDAKTIANWMAKVVEGVPLNEQQQIALEENPILDRTFQDVIINPNSTVNQRTKGLADFVSNVKSGKMTSVATDTANAVAGEAKPIEASESATAEESATQGKYEVSDDGKTKRVSTGEDVAISGVESIENGEVKLRLESGEVVDASEVAFSTHDEGVLYEMVTRMGDVSPQTATKLINHFKATDGVTAQVYAADIPLAYRYGKINYAKGLENLDITIDQRQTAFYHGRQAAEAEAKAKQAAITEKGSVGSAENRATTKGKIVYEFELDEKKIEKDPLRKASLEGIKLISKFSSLEIHVFESFVENGKRVAYVDGKKRSAPNGYFKGDNKIYVDINAGNNGEGTMLYTMSHEIAHYIRKWNVKGFKELGDFLIENFGKVDAPVDELINSQIAKLKRSYEIDNKALPSDDVLYDKAYEELVADSMSKMFADEQAYTKLAELKKQNFRLFKKFGEAIRKMLDKIKSIIGAYSERSPDANEAKYVEQFSREVYEKLQDMYLKAFVNADDNYQAYKGGEDTASEGVTFSLRDNVEETKELVAVHNLTEEKLLKSLNLGGLPMPSTAIIKAKDGHSEFGEISLVFGRDTVDPQAYRSNKVYSGDAYTPTYPRVEYKINEKAANKIRDKIKGLVSDDIQDALGRVHLDPSNLNDTINRHSGDMATAFRYDYTMKYAYLLDKGINIELPMTEKPLSYYGYRENGAIIRVAEAVSKEDLLKVLNGSHEEADTVEPYIRKAVSEYMTETYADQPEVLEALQPKEQLRYSDLDGYAQEALNYLRDGIKQIVDYKATKLLIDENIDQAEYEKWVKDLFADIVEKEGIRNNKDYFTPSGNRRSFEALHYEHNLENVIKAMKENGTQGIGAFGGGNIFGASAKEFGSIEEIKGAADRLQMMSQEEYDEIRKGFSDRFFELAGSLPKNKGSYTATDDAANMLVEAVVKFSTKSGMANYLRRESEGWADYSDYIVDDLIELVKDIQNMPTGYFEAKPQRAVGFDEVATAIIPDNASEEIKSKLKQWRIDFVEYESGNKDARLEALNSLEDVMFSERDSSMSNSVFTEEEMLNIRRDVVKHFNLKGINGFEQVQRGVFNTLKANGFFESNGERKVVIKENEMEVTINRGSIKETFGSGNKYESVPAAFKILKLATIEQIPSIIESANVIAENEKNRHNNGENKAFTYLSGTATIEGKSVPVRVTLKISKEKNKFWVHNVDVTKNTDDIFQLGAKNANPTNSKLSSAEGIIAQDTDSVKRKDENNLYSERDSYAPTFYSQMSKVIDDIKLEKMGTASILNHLKNRGIKNEEIKWSGIEAFLEGKKSVTKAELQEFVAGSQLEIQEQMSDAVDVEVFSDDGDNYKVRNKTTGAIMDEWEYSDDVEDGMEGWVNQEGEIAISVEEIKERAFKDFSSTRWSDYKLDGGENYRELVFVMPNSSFTNQAMRAHWGEDAEGVLAHARVQDFDTADGKKMLFIEEIQSDWHNEGAKDGYQDAETESKIKRLKEEADIAFYELEDYSTELTGMAGEYEAVAKTQKGRELLRNYFKTRDALKDAENAYVKKVPDAPFHDNYHEYVLKRLLRMAAEEGYDSIGWTPADIQSMRWSEDYAEGYRIEYDQEIPKFLRKYGKKWGATVGKSEITESEHTVNGEHYDAENIEVWSMDITDSMKESVLYEGQPMYSERDDYTQVKNSLKNKYHVNTDDVIRLADSYFENYGGALNKTKFRLQFLNITEAMSKAMFDNKNVFDKVQKAVVDVAYEIAGNPKASGDTVNDLSNIKNYLRKTRIKIPQQPKGDFDIVGGFETFRKKHLGKFILANDGIDVDSLYPELQEIFGFSWFPDDIVTVPDQLMKIAEVVDTPLDSVSDTNYIDVDDAMAWVAGKIYEKIVNITTDALNQSTDVPADYRDPEGGKSNRSLLAKALENVAQNDIEKNKLKQYKEKIGLIEAEQAKLGELKAKIRELSFAKGARDTEAIKQLQFDAKQTENRINTYDRQLLNLEATTALKNVLEREKEMARKKEQQKAKDNLKAYKEKVAETQRELLTRWQESRKNAVEGRHKTEMRHKIKGVVADLNKLLLNESKDKHVPIGLQRPVAEALDIINMDTVGAQERVAKYNELIAKAKDPVEIDRLTKSRDRILMQGENLADKLASLKNAYAEFKESDDSLIRDAHNEAIENLISETAKMVGNTPIRDMSLAQLEAVYDMYKAVLATVRNANKMFKEGRQATISENSEAVKVEVRTVGGHHDRVRKSTKGIKSFAWELLKPLAAFKHIGSKTLSRLFGNVRAGEDTYARDLSEAKNFFKEQSSKYNYRNWDFKKRYTFKDITGLEFSLSLDQIMSLYAYSKRNQADRHLEVGGFVFDDAIEVREKNKLGIPVKYEVNDANPYRLNRMALGEITSALTSEQKAFVDEMQTYLSDVMGAKGNEISLAMYDIKLYKEKHYFPLKTSRYFRDFNPEQSGNPMLRNSGFSKKTVPQAGNPIVLSNFMEVWGGHVNDMSMYHSFVLPLEDFMRVYNYSSTAGGYDSVQQYIKNAYGAQANQYVEKLMQDINGGVVSGTLPNGWLKMFGKFKKATVAASLSTIVQQPTAVIRAMAKINPMHFVGVPFKGGHKKTWEKIKKYAPVAIIKEMGGIDVGSGRQATDFITAENYKGLGKIKGFFTDSDYRDSIFMWGAAKADELGWNAIWKATEREVASKNKFKPDTEEFYKAVGERFTEVITETQVYDSVFSRSGIMRDKGDLNKFATSFMGEPITSLNMLYSAVLDAKRGGSKLHAAREIGSVYVSIVAASALASVIYGLRDDDEDEAYLEKWAEAFGNKLSSEVWIHNMIPYVRDLASIIEGWDVERPDMSIFADIKSSFDKLYKINEDGEFEWKVDFSDPASVYSAIENFGGSIASALGLPVKNIMRETRSIFNAFKALTDDIKPKDFGSVIGAFGKGWTGEEAPKEDKLYEAIINGDEGRLKVYRESYKTEKSYETAVRKALRENDPRIKEAAQARIDGDIAEYTRIAKEIIAEGNFVQDIVVGAINSEINAINKAANDKVESADDKNEPEKVTSIYEADDINSALNSGDMTLATKIISELISVKSINSFNKAKAEAEKEGKEFDEEEELEEAEKSAKSSVKSSITKHWKPLVKAAIESNNTTEQLRIRDMLFDTGLYGKSRYEVTKTMREWAKED